MGTSRSGASGDRLEGWQEIADYLGRSIKTVQRYENDLGLPIRRPSSAKGKQRRIVSAYRRELDEWAATHKSGGRSLSRTIRSARWFRLTAATLLVLLLALGFWWTLGTPTLPGNATTSTAESPIGPGTPALVPVGSTFTESILYISDRSGYDEVWRTNVEGTVHDQLTEFEDTVLRIAASADGSRLALIRNLGVRGNFVTALFVSRGDGSEPNLVLVDHDVGPVRLQDVSWSIDNRTLLLATGGGCCDGNIWVVDTASFQFRPLLPNAFVGLVEVSPDGRKVLHNQREGDQGYAHPLRVTTIDTRETAPIVAECCDETSVVQHADWGAQEPQLVVVIGQNLLTLNMDGSNRTPLTRDGDWPHGVRYGQPSWSADQSRIVFYQATRTASDLWTMSADGKERTQITTVGHNKSPIWVRRRPPR